MFEPQARTGVVVALNVALNNQQMASFGKLFNAYNHPNFSKAEMSPPW